MSRLCVAITTSAVLLSACGGGGSAASDATAPAGSIAVAAAWRNFLQGGRTVVVSGRGINDANLKDDDFELTFVFEPAVTEVYGATGEQASRMTRTATVRTGLAGDEAREGVATDYYFDSNARLVGQRSRLSYMAPACMIATRSSPLPAAAGTTATTHLVTYQGPVDCSGGPAGTPNREQEDTWLIKSEGNTRYFCIATSDRMLGIVSTFTARSEVCLEVFADGRLGTKAIVTMNNDPWPPLVLKN